ncbi:trehalose-6-phosphate synthase [Hydrogenophaga sp. 5NK40-0174]
MGQALETTGGLWFGWSGKIREDGTPGEGELHTSQAGKVQLATVDLCREDYDSYYLNHSNGVLWPVFHYRLDLADFSTNDLSGYRRVNKLFAHKLKALLKPDDIIWVHDYHLIPLAAELRAMGCQQRMGFFLHIPLPPPLIMAAIPQHDWLMRSLFAYDLVGFQSQADVTHFRHYAETELKGSYGPDDIVEASGAQVRAKAFPIGIDVDEFQTLAKGKDALEMYDQMQKTYGQRKLLVGVERLDYSKGLRHRLYAFRQLLESYPENRGATTLVQIASPSRESVEAYDLLRQRLESLTGSINGDFGELDWTPVRYIHRSVARKRLPGLYRSGSVGLVTPLRDGMNLVAKEYVVAQNEKDPGVLVLSRFAGAAEQLDEALQVNPYDTAQMAETIQRALQMGLPERLERHSALMQRMKAQDVHWWSQTYLADLNASR